MPSDETDDAEGLKKEVDEASGEVSPPKEYGRKTGRCYDCRRTLVRILGFLDSMLAKGEIS